MSKYQTASLYAGWTLAVTLAIACVGINTWHAEEHYRYFVECVDYMQDAGICDKLVPR